MQIKDLVKSVTRYTLLAMLLLICPSIFAQGGSINSYSSPVTNRNGQALSGVKIAICQPLSTTAASITSNLAVLTMASNPQTAGFATGMALTVAGFTGGDTYFNGSFTVLSTTSTTITYSLVHANASASSNGNALQQGNASTSCAGLSTVYTDITLSTVGTNPFISDGNGNFTAWVVPGAYWIQFYGPGVTTSFKQVIVSGGGIGSGSTAASLNGAISTAQATGNCVIIPPDTTIQLTSGLNWSSSNACIIGSGPTSVIQLAGTGSFTAFSFIGTAGAAQNLGSDAAIGAITITLTGGGVAALGLNVGDYIFITDTQSPPAQENTRVKALNGDIITIEDVAYETFTVAHGTTVQKWTSPVLRMNLSNFLIDGSNNSGGSTVGILASGIFRSNIDHIWCRKVSSSCVTGDGGYKNQISHLNMEDSGNASAADLYMIRNTELDVNDVHSSHAGFGPEFINTNGSQFNNIWSVGSTGRGFKLAASSFNHLTNIHVTEYNVSSNGIFYDAGSHDNTMNNCSSLGATGAGSANLSLAVTGDSNNSFVGCKFLYSTSGAVDVATQTGANNNVIIADFVTINDLGTGNIIKTPAGDTLLNSQDNSGAITGTASDANIFVYTMPASIMHIGKGIRVTCVSKHTGTASTTYKINFGGTAYSFVAFNPVSTADTRIVWEVFNKAGVSNAQDVTASLLGSSQVQLIDSTTPTYDTTVAANVSVSFNVANTDTETPIKFLVELIQ